MCLVDEDPSCCKFNSRKPPDILFYFTAVVVPPYGLLPAPSPTHPLVLGFPFRDSGSFACILNRLRPVALKTVKQE